MRGFPNSKCLFQRSRFPTVLLTDWQWSCQLEISTGKFAGELDGFKTTIGSGVLAESLPQKLGFKVGAIGTHSSRTIMLEELSTLLDTVPADAGRTDYLSAIVEQNALAKQTGLTERLRPNT